MSAYLRVAAVRYAWSFVGQPYRWGGDDPILGFDCSGFVIEVLKGVGALPHAIDLTADELFHRFEKRTVARGYAGCIAIWFKDGKGVHVELMVDELHTLGASGGGPSTTSTDVAAAQNAFIKQRPVGYRGQGYIILDPFLAEAK